MQWKTRTRTVGIIGGMGPLATVAFHRLIVTNTVAVTDQEHLHVLVDSDPRIPDRTDFLLDRGPDPRPAMTASARRLVAAGAELLVMPCNTANAFAAEIADAAGVPIVPWLSTAVDAVMADSAGPEVHCGLLATTGSLRVGMYSRLIREAGGTAVEPTTSVQEAVMSVIYGDHGVKATGSVDAAGRAALLDAARHLVERGANVLLLGCTELPIALPADDPGWPVPAVDPAVVVARRVIHEAGADVAPVVKT